MWHKSLACGVAFLLPFLVARAAVPDFLPLPDDPARLMEHGSHVADVPAGSIAEGLGVFPGDTIVGIGSNRVFSTREAQVLIPLTPLPYTLTVRSGAEILKHRVEGLKDGRLGVNLDWDTVGPAWWLSEIYGLAPKDYMGAAVAPRADGGLLDGLLAKVDLLALPDHPLFQRLAAFPARAAHVLLEEGRRAKPDAARVAWVRSLLRAYMALSEEQYAVAARILADNKVTEQKVEPYLDALAAFYAAIAANPPDAETGPPPDGYGVSPAFANFCYPLPVRVERRYDWEPVLPKFNRAQFQKLPSGQWPDLGSITNRITGEQGHYLASICVAFMDDERNGGWPSRSFTIYDKNKRKKHLATYARMIKEGDPLKVLAAYGLIAPSMLEQRSEEFRLAMDTLAEAGTREFVNGLWILDQVVVHWSLKKADMPAFVTAHRKAEERLGIPALYLWMEWNDPAFETWLAYGYWQRNGGLVTDRCLSFFQANPRYLQDIWPKPGK